MNDIIWLTMRRMRTPLILLLMVYAISVFGLTLMPGQDPTGTARHMSFFEAAYFVAFMSTTIGFGEIPYDFSPAQRLWTFAIIYPNVIAWLYSIGTILGLFLDPQFRAVLKRSRFSQRVRWQGEPFYIVCGFGNTGSLIVQGLLQRGLHATVLERDEAKIHRMLLLPEFSDVPTLTADVTNRQMLELAGLHHPQCQGVMATTNDDHANLTIAITCKLLRPELTVLARSESTRVSANMASFSTDFIVDPYEIFAERMSLAMNSPAKYLVQDWLISVPGSQLRESMDPPAGRWIVCGLGRFGEKMAQKLQKLGIAFTAVDIHPDRLSGYESTVTGRGTEAHTLQEAGIESAVGIIAGTGDDVDNLSIVMTALELNQNLFVVARQELRRNDHLFDASGAHLTARRSLIVARRILAVVTTPLLQSFLQHLVRQDEDWTQSLINKLQPVLRGRAPNLWLADINKQDAEGFRIAKKYSIEISLIDLMRNTRVEGETILPCVCLVLERGAQRIFMPEPDQSLQAGDRLLFAGRGHARREIIWTLQNPNTLLGYATGRHIPRGAIWRWFARRNNQPDGE